MMIIEPVFTGVYKIKGDSGFVKEMEANRFLQLAPQSKVMTHVDQPYISYLV